MKPIRVLMVAPSMGIVGGQSVQAARLLEELRRQPGLEIAFQPVDPNFPAPIRPLKRVKYLRTLVNELIYFAHLLARVPHYDILHLFSAGGSSFLLAPAPGIFLARLLGKRIILNYRDGRAEGHLGTSPLAVRIMRSVDRIVVPSGFLVGVFARFGLKAESIFNVIDTSRIHLRERPRPRPIFIHNRGLETLYNVPCTLRAFAIIQQTYPEARLKLAHDGPLRPALEALAAQLALRNVDFVGRVSQERMRDLYDEADIYLMSPNIDNMPGSVLECYASGLPLVSTDAGGVPFVVRHEETGLLVPCNDHVAMAAAALRLIEEDGLALRLARNGWSECAHYQGPAIAAEWASLYSELLSGVRTAAI